MSNLCSFEKQRKIAQINGKKGGSFKKTPSKNLGRKDALCYQNTNGKLKIRLGRRKEGKGGADQAPKKGSYILTVFSETKSGGPSQKKETIRPCSERREKLIGGSKLNCTS